MPKINKIKYFFSSKSCKLKRRETMNRFVLKQYSQKNNCLWKAIITIYCLWKADWKITFIHFIIFLSYEGPRNVRPHFLYRRFNISPPHFISFHHQYRFVFTNLPSHIVLCFSIGILQSALLFRPSRKNID